MDSQKKQYFDHVQKWDENMGIIWEKESEYNSVLVKKFKIFLDEVKDQLRIYFNSNNFHVMVKSSFIEAKYESNLLLVRVEFPEVTPDSQYNFKLSIVEDSRREFIIHMILNGNQLYLPKISNIRHRPQDTRQLIDSIRDLEREYILLNDKIEEIERINVHYFFHSAQRIQYKIDELKNYDSFITILTQLLSN